MIFEKSSLKNQIIFQTRFVKNQVQINRESSKNEACVKCGTHKCHNPSLVTESLSTGK